jgi:hypothetical protein
MVVAELAGLDATAQDEQSGVLAGTERVGSAGGGLPPEVIGLVVVAWAAAVEAFGADWSWL